MEFSSSDKQVIDLLSKLKNTGGTYPAAIMASRREAYMKQVANIGLGIGMGTPIKNTAKRGTGAGTVATVTSKILETALITAIVLEAGAAAYLYRDKIASLIRTSSTSSSSVQEVSTPSEDAASSSNISIKPTESPSGTVTVSPSTVTSAPSPSSTVTTLPNTVTTILVTPSPEAAKNQNSGANINSGATPKPGGNNGNHYGQTPKPEQTKDNNKDNKNNNDSEHKDKNK